MFETEGVTVVGSIEGGITPRKAFMMEHPLGAGKIIMLGSLPQGEEGNNMLVKMMDHYVLEAGVVQRTDVTCGTIIALREVEEGQIVCVIVNMDGVGGQVTIPGPAEDLLTGSSILSGKLAVGPYQYCIVRFK